MANRGRAISLESSQAQRAVCMAAVAMVGLAPRRIRPAMRWFVQGEARRIDVVASRVVRASQHQINLLAPRSKSRSGLGGVPVLSVHIGVGSLYVAAALPAVSQPAVASDDLHQRQALLLLA